jgi:hypothetical protein
MTRGPWLPVGDFAHMVFRTSQVGTTETPLVGAYSTKGWAHPGPLLFWLAAPLYRLSGGDPRSVEWTLATLNLSCLVALLLVAWRRGRTALLLAVSALVALLVHGISAGVLVTFWNPYVPLLPFLLTVVLVWDAGLGRWRSAALALVPASIAIQGHIAFAVLGAALAVWLVAWRRWGDHLGGPPADAGVADSGAETRRARRAVPRWVWAVVALMWIGPVADALFDLHNPLRIAASLARADASLGPLRAIGVVGRHVRPDGPWTGGAEPVGTHLSVEGSGPLPLVVACLALAWCLHVARRRRLRDVGALATLTLALLAVSLPATAQIVLPAFSYLPVWLKVIGGLVWFTVAWTIWRVVEPRVRSASTTHRVLVAGAAGAVVVAAPGAGLWAALDAEQPAARQSAAVGAIIPDLEANVPRDRRLRVETRGDFTASATPGVVHWLIDRGYDVVTGDGGDGLKWGHPHRWERGDDHDVLLTVALDGAVVECELDPSARELARYDGLEPSERAWLNDVRFRRLAGEAVTGDEDRREAALASRDMQLAVFAAPRICASPLRIDFGEANSGWLLPAAAGAALAGVAAASVSVRRRRAGPTAQGPHDPA